MEFIEYLKTLKPKDWEKKISDKWTIKDVIAHLVGWEKEAAKTFKESWYSGEKPWFMSTDNFDDFNDRVVTEYKNYPPESLIEEWSKWQKELDRLVKEAGEDKVQSRYKEFGWVMDVGEDSHYDHHLKQIKKILDT